MQPPCRDEQLGAINIRHVGVVIIGRNEGKRLADCISSVEPMLMSTIYVDSGSTDGSVAFASNQVASVVQLDLSVPFTAARARNAGAWELMRLRPDLEFIQFVDGDCMLDPDWVTQAAAFMAQRTDVAIVFGRRRERYPDRSVYNLMCDGEWNTPAGESFECGGDSLVRVEAFCSAGGFRSSLVAGEEPELCVRLREKGWKIWRLAAEMTLHDANILYFWQWWVRNVRAGHAFAEVSRLHASSKFGIWKRKLLRSVSWTLLPVAAIIASVSLNKGFLLLLILLPLQVARLAARAPASEPQRWISATFNVVGKFAECQGVLRFYKNLWLGKQQTIIEYK